VRRNGFFLGSVRQLGTLQGRDGNGSALHWRVPSHPPFLFNNWEDFFSISITIGFGARAEFPIIKLNSNNILIILGFPFFT
jgi:hypothetical protein